MRKTALNEKTLLNIEKPARYTGGEFNSVMKDKERIAVRFAMCFPDVYEIGMSHLGIQILYHMFNQMEDVWCERVYSPWPDLDRIMREESIPLFALESQDPIRDFDFLGVTLQYEMCYTNILQILDLGGIPILQADRSDSDPIVIGGGPCAYNPEPIADFFDIFYIGEGETVYGELLRLYKEERHGNYSRAAFLRKAAKIPGIYVPSLYNVIYNEDGTIQSFTPMEEDIPAQIQKQVVMDLTSAPYPDRPIVPYIRATQDRAVLEIQRGCIRGCRFCQAGMIYRPTRERDPKTLMDYAARLLENTGYEEITLSSLSSSDYRSLKELTEFLVDYCKDERVNISLPSLRIDAFSLDVMSRVQDIYRSSLTFAPEAGTQRMRDVINKGITEEDILNGCASAFGAGWNKVKLYFMMGLPTETEADILGIAELAEKVAEKYYEIPKENRHGKCAVTASASFFIPKPFTPFQWSRMITKEECDEKARSVSAAFREQLNRKSMKFQYHAPDVSVLEGVLARGDRKLSAVILAAYRHGSVFDAWTEFFDISNWNDAFAETGIDPGFYTRERNLDEILPWDFIDIGVTKDFMKKEWERAKLARITPNCREQCSGCGASRFGGGVCYEREN